MIKKGDLATLGRVKPLSDNQIKALKPKDKVYKIPDGDGLYIYVNPTGSKVWKMRYTLNDKNSTKTIGQYPTVSLKDARIKRDEYRDQIQGGIKPSDYSGDMTFKDISKEYLELRSDVSEKYKGDISGILERDFYDDIGHIKIGEITPTHLIQVYKSMERRGIKTATKKAGSLVNRIFKYAVTMQYTDNNPMASVDLTILLKKHTPKNFAHVTDLNMFRSILKTIEIYEGIDIYTRTALRFMPYAFVRPANIRAMLWEEIDLKNRLWIIPKEKMKMGRDHIVPLTDTMIDILNNIKRNGSDFVFPSPQSTKRQLSENTLNVALKRMGFKDIMTSHGFRHTASTILHENIHNHKISSDVIEMQLAHVEKNSVKGVYNKALYLDERIRLMEWWSNYLDDLKSQKD